MQEKYKSMSNVPNLRFPEFSGEWEVNKLVEITEKIGDGLHGTPKYIDDSNLYFINGNNLVNGKIELNVITKKIDLETFSKNDKGLNENTLLISINGTIGSIAKYNQEKVMLGKSVGYFNFSKSSDFFYFALQTNSVQDFFISELTGSTIKNLSLKTLRETAVFFPSANEQQKIANFLSLVDERIQTQSKIIEELKVLKCSISKKIFSQQLRFKDDKGNDFPDWEVKKLGKIGTFFSGGTPLTSKKHYFNGDIPFIRSGEINANYTEQYISKEGLKNSSAKMIEVGDLIYALYGATSGEVGISKIEGAINQAILCVRTNMNNIFLLNYLRIQKENIINTYLQGGQGNLSAEIIKSLEIPIPSLEEQGTIANFLSQIDEKIEIEKQLLIQYENQKKYLLQNLFI